MKQLKLFALIFLFNTILIINSILAQSSKLTFSEIMFSPSESSGEFIEIYNTSITETIDLSGYKIKYYTSSNNNLAPLTEGTKLFPGKFAVIIQGSYDYANGIYKTLIPEGTIVFKTSGNNFGSSGMANTTDRTVSLIDPFGQAVDVYTYSANNSAGYSDEKIEMTKDNSGANWGNSTRKHGTPGFKNSISPVDYDLCISFLTLTQVVPDEKDSINVTLVVKNIGKKSSMDYVVNIFNDLNSDSVGEVDEEIFLRSFTNLAAGDSLIIKKNVYAASPGNCFIIGTVFYAEDEDTSNNKSYLKVTVAEKPAMREEIIINEFMYAPLPDEPEWIEIYNRSGRSFNLKNWKVGDASSQVTITNEDIFLNTGEYLVISDDSSINEFFSIPSQVIIKNIPSLNNTGDEIKLINEFGKVIDSLKYLPSWGGGNGKSLERINAVVTATLKENWKSSISEFNATPGKQNSVVQKQNDVAAKFNKTQSQFIIGEPVNIVLVVKNLGKKSALNIPVNIYYDTNNDSIPQAGEAIYSRTVVKISSSDSIIIHQDFSPGSLGKHLLIAYASYDADENITNNKDIFPFSVIDKPIGEKEIVINEIMYAPVSGEPEWIELYNCSSRPVNLKNIKIGDGAVLIKITGDNYLLNAGEYVVISEDAGINDFYRIPSAVFIKSFPGLNNSGGEIFLRDSSNNVIDHILYSNKWGGLGGKSLERISAEGFSSDSANWKSSSGKFKATPGRVNSVSQKNYDIALKAITASSPYVEFGKDCIVNVEIENTGRYDAENFSFKFYNDLNGDGLLPPDEIIDEVKYLQLEGGKDKELKLVLSKLILGKNNLTGILEYANDEYGDNDTVLLVVNCVKINEQRGDIIINEIMYAPVSPEPEWIEIYNRSEKQININKYCIGSGSNSNMVFSSTKIILPGDYYIIAKDSMMFSIYPNVQNTTVTYFPSLNNSGSRIVLSDSLGRIIDSVFYKSAWGGLGGRSLERINVFGSSCDSANWRSSIYKSGGSPSRINSVSKKNIDGAAERLIFDPARPLIGSDVRICSEIKNIGIKDFTFDIILYELENENSKKKLEQIQNLFLKTGDSLICKFNYKLVSITFKNNYEVELVVNGDEDLTNNIASSFIIPGYNPGNILLNEIMFNPANGEPEWIEMYNNSENDINLDGWSVIDIFSIPLKTKLKPAIFPKKSYFVVSKDTSIIYYHKEIPSRILINNFANLNNDKDGVVIKDFWDNTIDSVLYLNSWGSGSGKSLERKSFLNTSNDKSNWASSKDIELSTPGRINSITRKDFDLSIAFIKTNPSPPRNGDEVFIIAEIKNEGIIQSTNFKIEFYFYDDDDTTLFSSVNVENINPLDSIDVSSSEKIKFNEQINILCSLILPGDQDLSNNILNATFQTGCNRSDVLISEIMYNPLDGESEWIEIFNTTTSPVNLKNWSVSDFVNPVRATISQRDLNLQPGEYAVIARDTINYMFYPPRVFLEVKYGALGNTLDGIMIYDNAGAVIDSVEYNSTWGGQKGFSIERISFDKPSNDISNWFTSINVHGASPGIKNSANECKTYKTGSLVINEIMFDPEKGNSEFLEFYNTGNDSIQIGGMKLQVGASTLKICPTYFIVPPGDFLVLSADSNIIKNYSTFNCDNHFLVVNKSLSLLNEGSIISLRDTKGNNLDSIYYSPAWQNKNIINKKNRSLERLNPSLGSNDMMNWSSSVCSEGATPGKQNSVFVQNVLSENKINVSPNPFSPDNDGFEDFTLINFNLAKPLAQIRIKVFDSMGRLVRTLEQNMPASSKGTAVFNGLDDNGRALRIGIYVLLIEIFACDGTMEKIKTPVVVARKL